MKFSIFIIAILVVLSNASFVRKTTSSNILAQIDGEHYGNAILSTIAVHFQTGAPIEDTLNLLNEILDQLNADKTAGDDTFSQIQAFFTQLINNDQQTLVDTQANIDTENSILSSNQDYLTELQTQQTDAQNQLAQVSSSLDSGNATRASQNADFQQRDSDTSDAVEAIDEAFALVNHLSAGTSFAQLKSHFQRVQQKLQQHSKSHVLYTPIIQTMTQLASKADQESVQRILSLLQRIKQALVDQQNQDRASENQQQQDWDDQFNNLSQQKNSLNEKLNQLDSAITSTTDVIKKKQELISDLGDLLQRVQDQLDQATTSLDQITSKYNAAIAELEREVDILSTVIDNLTKGASQLQDYLKDRIDQ